MDDVLDRGERFEFRALPRVPWRLRLRRMTPAHSGVTVDTDAVRVRAGTWWMTIRFDEIAGALARGDRVELRGFGAFSVKTRDPRQGRNPRTGETVSVEGKAIPFFKTGKQLREKLNVDGGES